MTNQSLTDTALGRAMTQWALSRPTLVAETPNSLVYRVEQKSGPFAALKLYRDETERCGTALLGWYGGTGAARLIAADEAGALLEWIEGKHLAEPARTGRDREATEALGFVAQQLHAERAEPPPESLVPLRDWFSALIDSRASLWPQTARDLYGRAKGIALTLFDRPTADRPLHGDLHHDNIMAAERGWVAIDPKGLRGDPAYEFAPAFLNPWDARDLVIRQARIGHMATSFSARLGLERKRVLGFAVAHAALTICWDISAGRPFGHQLAVLPNLLAVWAEA